MYFYFYFLFLFLYLYLFIFFFFIYFFTNFFQSKTINKKFIILYKILKWIRLKLINFKNL